MRRIFSTAERFARPRRNWLQSRELVVDVIKDALCGVITCDATAPHPANYRRGATTRKADASHREAGEARLV
jgi:hypothetical protein